jgi:hypothetical protein
MAAHARTITATGRRTYAAALLHLVVRLNHMLPGFPSASTEFRR